jgi:hypothetical protein
LIAVKIPKDVLDLFPMWQYQCSKCGHYDEPKQVCIKCGTAIDLMRDRISPRFMKSHKAMSEYAHRVLAPKLSLKQRTLLFKHFTEFFSDGFEDGTFDAWDGTVGSPSVVAGGHHGSYQAELDVSGEEFYKNISDEDLVYFRVYVKWSVFPDDGKRLNMPYICQPTYQGVVSLALINDGGEMKWQLWYFPDGGFQYDITATQELSVDTWYCLEIMFKTQSASDVYDGEYEVYVDGELLLSRDSIHWNYNNKGCNRIAFQLNLVGGGTVPVLNADCIVVADAYIGPLPTEIFVANDFPRAYLEKPVKAKELANKIEGVTVIHVAKDFPEKLMKKGAAAQLQSYWEY